LLYSVSINDLFRVGGRGIIRLSKGVF